MPDPVEYYRRDHDALAMSLQQRRLRQSCMLCLAVAFVGGLVLGFIMGGLL